ncbi:MAG: DUF305 domain-containing protein [Gammaproteobacteria bacterium]|jgi:uncharacterized protein (DUF305 family)|nr:DUF305 domain-containing protein [Gammaproteobacteria bacterium]MDP6732550.1 DUF305 domain-containing protein [Gammaproteobacteria bacterium]
MRRLEYLLINKQIRIALAASVALFAIGQSLAQVPIIQPGAPGQPGRIISAEQASDLAAIQYAAGDIQFLQGMISHHAQAMEMAELVESRSTREAMVLLAQRISLSQDDEIAMMQGWLSEHDQAVPGVDAHHATDFELMPGMLSDEQMAELEQAQAAEFDSLFLGYMIDHHLGAIEMVDNLLDQRGAAQDPVLYAFTSDITSDQSSEIERMDAMLAGFSPDPRVNLSAGFRDAGEAALNLQLVASLPKPAGFFDPENPSGIPVNRREEEETLAPDTDAVDDQQQVAADQPNSNLAETPAEEEEEDENADPRPSLLSFSNTDLLFSGNYLVAGNYHGFNTYDISNPSAPQLLSSVVCPGGQGDVSLAGNLLIMSVQETRGRLDCGLQGVPEPTSQQRIQGIRIFDVSDFNMPVQVGAVQTCRGSHTHTIVSNPDETGNVYVYVSGTSGVRDEEELSGCSDDSPFEDPDSALFRIEVIEIPMDRPEDAQIVSRPFIFSDPESGILAGLWEGGDHGEDTQRTSRTSQCHDITTFPEIGLAAGACSGNGILLDISDPADPQRLDQVIDPGFAFWHSATFNNEGTKVIFTDEWGGGGRPRCRAQDPLDWGADAFYDIVDGKLQFRSHYKMSAPQSENENCVAHNGSLIPVPGRDIFVQAWYQGGISVVDFTDSSNPVEIAYFDRGPMADEEMVMAGYWSTYWYGGYIFGTEIARGLDVFALEASDYLTENEIAAASLKEADLIVNAQTQQKVNWPTVPVVARAYLDQLLRSDIIAAGQADALSSALETADNLITRGSEDSALASRMDDLAATMEDEAVSRSGTSRTRYLALAETLEGIADRLR